MALLEIKNLTFGFPEQPLLFEDFSLDVASRERVALEARSGFGKTTLCRLICGYEKPLRGSITIDGTPTSDFTVNPVQLIGQHPEQMLDPRLRLKTSLAEAGEPTEDLLKSLGIKTPWLNRYPHELSGGELQRFCIARALLTHPKFLVADEISTMLDAVAQAQIWHQLLDYADRHDTGILFVSHSPALRRQIATRVVNLEETAPPLP